MGRINVLSVETSNKIAAGEVVERPSSVVKELIENSIDAGANSIIIEIEDGGQKSIKVTDNGVGIHPEDIEKAFLPHATSKINTASDLFEIKTLGFRGEALASIASVAKVTLSSRKNEMDYGREIFISSGKVEYVKDVGINVGTIAQVQDLFFNVPARLRFLKSSSRESALISDIVSRLALSNSNVSFKLFSNSKKTVSTVGSKEMLDTIRSIYSKEFSENIFNFERHSDTISAFGFIGNASISRGSRNNQSIFVNGRLIKNRLITAAVENAFKSFITINKFPFFILFIQIYPEFVDVNVHPTKSEVKFQDDRVIYKVVFDSVHEALRNNLRENFSIAHENTIEDSTIVYAPPGETNTETRESRIEYQVPLDLKVESRIYEKPETLEKEVFQSKPMDKPKAKFDKYRVIGQFDNTYILAEGDKELFVIDQHAAHEKVLFEKYSKEIENANVVSQILLYPIVIELSEEDFSYYTENIEVFKSTGFEIDLFGDNTLNLKEVPLILGKPNMKNLFIDILEDLKNMGSGNTKDIQYSKIAKRACKSAVKANDSLSKDEIETLLEDLRYLDDPFTCPHGRPTIIKITLNELEKRFKRI